MISPIVSICCITYNQAPYIRECLDGFIMQKCNFDFEILIHDDASTDGTQDIIKEYQQKHPNIIKPVFQTENQYSKGQRGMNIKYNFPRAEGKYIALCEGDDYWIDPLKLQKQVDFLEMHIDFSMTVGGYSNLIDTTLENCISVHTPEMGINGYEVTFEMFLLNWLTKTLTLMFRKSDLEKASFNNYKYMRDVHLIYHLFQGGKCMYLLENFGVYRVHDGGVHSGISQRQKRIVKYHVTKEIYLETKDKRYRRTFLDVVKSVYYHDQMPSNRGDLLKEMFRLCRTPYDYLKIFNAIIFHFKNRFINSSKNEN